VRGRGPPSGTPAPRGPGGASPSAALAAGAAPLYGVGGGGGDDARRRRRAGRWREGPVMAGATAVALSLAALPAAAPLPAPAAAMAEEEASSERWVERGGRSIRARTALCIAAVRPARSRRTCLPASRRRSPSARLLSVWARCGAGSLPPWAACCGSLAARGPRARLGVAEPCAGRLPFPSSGAGQLAQLYALTPFFLCPNIHSKQRSCRTSACPVFDIPLVLCVTSDSHLSVLLRYSCSSLCCLMWSSPTQPLMLCRPTRRLLPGWTNGSIVITSVPCSASVRVLFTAVCLL